MSDLDSPPIDVRQVTKLTPPNRFLGLANVRPPCYLRGMNKKSKTSAPVTFDCTLCDAYGPVFKDIDLDMWLCTSCYGEYNNIPAEIELDEVW
jgi:hypothetical protein